MDEEGNVYLAGRFDGVDEPIEIRDLEDRRGLLLIDLDRDGYYKWSKVLALSKGLT